VKNWPFLGVQPSVECWNLILDVGGGELRDISSTVRSCGGWVGGFDTGRKLCLSGFIGFIVGCSALV
jgi:hypothetical protein